MVTICKLQKHSATNPDLNLNKYQVSLQNLDSPPANSAQSTGGLAEILLLSQCSLHKILIRLSIGLIVSNLEGRLPTPVKVFKGEKLAYSTLYNCLLKKKQKTKQTYYSLKLTKMTQ